MKYNIKEFSEEINRVKGMVDGTKKTKAIEMLCERYKVSQATIYRHLKKRMPGIRKARADRGKEKVKPSVKEVKLAAELIKAGKSRQEAKKEIETVTGRKVTSTKLRKLSERLKKENPEIEISGFGKVIKIFLEKYFQLDNIAPEANIPIKLGTKEFEIKREDFEDIIMILTNAYNRKATNGDRLKLDRDQMRERMLMNLFEWQIQVASETGNIKDVETLSRIYDRMKPESNMDVNIKTLELVCKELRPDITLKEIIGILRKVAN